MDQLIESPAFEDFRQTPHQHEQDQTPRRHQRAPTAPRHSVSEPSPGEQDDEGPWDRGFDSAEEEVDGEWDGRVDEKGPADFGILCANSGGDYRAEERNQRFLGTLLETPAHVICLQEASQRLCNELKLGCDQPNQIERVRLENNTRRIAKNSPEQRMLVVRGREDRPTTAVAVRDAHFKGVKRRFFALQDAGDTRYMRGWGNQVFNRLMYCTLKCRSDYFEQPDSDDTDDIGIAVAHVHCGCSNKNNNRGGTTYKAFWDKPTYR